MPKKLNTAKKPKEKAVSPEVLKIINDLNKKFGDNAVTLGVPKHMRAKEYIPTGSLSLDIDLGGGIPVGRFIEISGKESSTKTTQTCHIIANAQKLGHTVVFADVEGTSDEDYFEHLGVDTSKLIYCKPDSAEEATEIILQLQRNEVATVGVIDSIAQMIPNKEAESKMDETVRMGIPQQLLSEFFRKWNANNNRLEREGKKPFTLIGINQLREKIGAYGDPEYAPGGNAKNFSASVIIRFRRGDWISEGKGDNRKIVGQVTKYNITKNKLYKRMQSGEFNFYFAENSADVKPLYNDNLQETIVLGVDWGVIERKGAWFYFNNVKYQGLENLVEDLRKTPEVLEDIKNQILELAVKVK